MHTRLGASNRSSTLVRSTLPNAVKSSPTLRTKLRSLTNGLPQLTKRNERCCLRTSNGYAYAELC